jgi:hypothetical protein
MRKDALQRGLPAPDEACAKHHYLHQRVEAPDLATIKIFLILHRNELRQNYSETHGRFD